MDRTESLFLYLGWGKGVPTESRTGIGAVLPTAYGPLSDSG